MLGGNWDKSEFVIGLKAFTCKIYGKRDLQALMSRIILSVRKTVNGKMELSM